MKHASLFSVIALAALFASCDKNDDYDNGNPPPPVFESTVVKIAGDSAGILGSVNQFRLILGDSVNLTPNKTSGRREINWDGVPADLSNNSLFPVDFFNNTDPNGPAGRKRGLAYVNPGPGFRVDTSAFADIEPSYANQFTTFSRRRLFSPVATNVTEINFKIAGTNTDAFVKGFGLIFVDVDDANSTSIEFFNGNKSLGVFKVPVSGGPKRFSFLGVSFKNEKVTRVKITAGNAALAAGTKDITDGGTKDIVVMDDFFYDEPKTLN
ncbi:MAG: hypothetical protein H7Y31_12485 [Chitinophagaceae bacterium]|nr:hypothetical protein [Chitinophagaceae bacterium]